MPDEPTTILESESPDKKLREVAELDPQKYPEMFREMEPGIFEVKVPRGGAGGGGGSDTPGHGNIEPGMSDYQKRYAEGKLTPGEWKEQTGFEPPGGKGDYISIEEYNKAVKEHNKEQKAKQAEAKKEVALAKFVEEQDKKRHAKLPDGKWIKNTDLALVKRDNPEGYKILKSKGFEAYQATLIELKGGTFIPKSEFQKIPNNYRVIGLNRGFDAMVSSIKNDETRREQALKVLESYKTKDGGYDLFKAIGKVSPETMSIAGFNPGDIRRATQAKQAAEQTGVSLPTDAWIYKEKPGMKGIEVTNKQKEAIVSDWKDARAKLIEQGKASEVVKLIGTDPSSKFSKSVEESRRFAIQGTSTLLFLPAKAALPEVRQKDIKGIDYAVGSAQLATWSMPLMPKNVIPIASIGAGGIFGYATGKNWPELSTGQKALSVAGIVLVSLPAIASIAKTAIPVAVKVPLRDGGEATVWTGVSVKGKPVIGISEGKPTIGTMGIKRPSLAEIKLGYEPVTKIETTLLGTRKALAKMGVSEADIIKVEETLKTRGMFAGKKSPFMSKEDLLVGTERINPGEMRVILEQTVKNSKQIDQLYGSSTIRPQLKPELRQWRGIHDIDIQTTMSSEEMAEFTSSLNNQLRKLGSKVKVDPEAPGTILKNVKGKWEKITDIHSKEQAASSELAPEGAYGMIHKEPTVNIKLPGIGKLELMKLSESGKRKAASILEFQEKGVAPPKHRINDIADYYVILHTFKGEKIADAWAKAYGYSPAKLIKVAERSPLKLDAFKLSPSSSRTTGSPKVSVSVPAYISSSLSPSLSASIKSYSLLVSPSISVRTSASPSRPVSPSSASAVISPIINTSPSPSPGTSPSPSPGTSPSPSPGTSPSPSGLKRQFLPIIKTEKSKRKAISNAKLAIAWRQGELHGKNRYDVVIEPFTSEQEYMIVMGRRPKGARLFTGPKSAFRTAAKLYGPDFKGGIIDQPGIFSVKVEPISGRDDVSISFIKDIEISGKSGKITNNKVFPLPRG